MTEPPIDDETLKLLAELRARGEAEKLQMLEIAGSVLSADKVAERLGISRAAVLAVLERRSATSEWQHDLMATALVFLLMRS
jgi:transcriptional regulator with XRE-family HTH domain